MIEPLPHDFNKISISSEKKVVRHQPSYWREAKLNIEMVEVKKPEFYGVDQYWYKVLHWDIQECFNLIKLTCFIAQNYP